MLIFIKHGTGWLMLILIATFFLIRLYQLYLKYKILILCAMLFFISGN